MGTEVIPNRKLFCGFNDPFAVDFAVAGDAICRLGNLTAVRAISRASVTRNVTVCLTLTNAVDAADECCRRRNRIAIASATSLPNLFQG